MIACPQPAVAPKTETVTFEAFTSAHLDAGVALSRAEHWPHRRDDWAMVLKLSRGVAAMAGGRLVGTAFATPFGRVAMLNLIIVAAEMRGRGLGGALIERAMAGVKADQWRLIATRDGLPLYRKFGFAEAGEIVQHQGPVAAVAKPDGVAWAAPADAAALVALDRAATGMDRATLVSALLREGRAAVLRDGEALSGYAVLRPFGRGEVVGPVIAASAEDARRLIAFLVSGRDGAFMRVDTPVDSGLAPWLEEIGLAHAGGGIPMTLGKAPCAPAPVRAYALASQALG